jgi:hypothetical protein
MLKYSIIEQACLTANKVGIVNVLLAPLVVTVTVKTGTRGEMLKSQLNTSRS